MDPEAYNAFGELITATAPTGAGGAAEDTVYTYDNAGRLTRVQDANSKSTTYGYDPEGRITSVTPAGLSSSWSIDYDSAGERVRVTDPDGQVRDFTYDTLGRPWTSRETRDGSHNYTTTSHYDGFSELTSVDDPRGITLNFTYDPLGRRTGRSARQGAQTVDSETLTGSSRHASP